MGDDRILIYNDTYAVIAGSRHPHVVGMPVRNAWPEAWDELNKPMHDACFAGEVLSFQDKHFVLDRGGTPADIPAAPASANSRKPVREALSEVLGQGFVTLLNRVYRDGGPFCGQNVHIQLERRDDQVMTRRVLDFVYQPLKDANDQIWGVFVEGIDITDHPLAEERLRVA